MIVSPNARFLVRPHPTTSVVFSAQRLFPQAVRKNVLATSRLFCCSHKSKAKGLPIANHCRSAHVRSSSSWRGRPASDKVRGSAFGGTSEHERRRARLLAYANAWQKKMVDAETVPREKHAEKVEYLQRLTTRLEKDPYGTLFRNDVWTPADMWRALGGGPRSPAEERNPRPGHQPDHDPPRSRQPDPRPSDPHQPDPRPSGPHQPDRPIDFHHGDATEKYHIDPITSRKVYEQRPSGLSEPPEASTVVSQDIASARKQNSTSTVDHSINPFPTTMTDLNQKEIEALAKDSTKKLDSKSEESQSWLTREGFSRHESYRPLATAQSTSGEATRGSGKPKSMETALDRKLRDIQTPNTSAPVDQALGSTGESASKESDHARATSIHKSSIIKDEDIDLLRASDVRASAGRARSNHLDQSREERWKALEQTFEKRVRESEARHAEELGTLKGCLGRIRHVHKPKPIPSSPCPPSTANPDISAEKQPPQSAASEEKFLNKIQSLENEYARQQEAEAHKLEEEKAQQAKERRRKAEEDALAAEVHHQKAAMEAHETPGLETQKSHGPGASRTTPWQPTIRKTPVHKDFEQKVKDRALVREIRGIYEDRYGRINTKHRQHPADPPVDATRDTLAKPKVGGASTASADREGDQKTSWPWHQRDWKGKPHPISATSAAGSRSPVQSRHKLVQMYWSKNSPRDGESAIQKARGKIHTKLTGKLRSMEEDPPATRSEKHRSSSSSSSNTSPRIQQRAVDHTPEPSSAHVYKILALSQASKDVSVATMISSLPETTTPKRSVSSILVHLDQPTKFFTHMDALGTAGYELIDGSRDMLVYKKVEEMAPEMIHEMQKTITSFLRLQSTEAGTSAARESVSTAAATSGPANETGSLTTSPAPLAAETQPPISPPSALFDSTPSQPALSTAADDATTVSVPQGAAPPKRTVHREEPIFSGAHKSPAQRQFDKFQRIHRKTYRAMRKEMRRRDDEKKYRRRLVLGAVLAGGAVYGLGWYAEARAMEERAVGEMGEKD